jgi:hypothetical protein
LAVYLAIEAAAWAIFARHAESRCKRGQLA